MDYSVLARTAIEHLTGSYTPYSGFNVSAALLCRDGRVYTGVNIENAAYTPSVCAERTAFFKAVSEGERTFTAIAIAGCRRDYLDTPMYLKGVLPKFVPPCGVCRQVMQEFTDPESFDVVLVRSVSDLKVVKLSKLLPMGFGAFDMEK